jgi:hypothetical protein
MVRVPNRETDRNLALEHPNPLQSHPRARIAQPDGVLRSGETDAIGVWARANLMNEAIEAGTD